MTCDLVQCMMARKEKEEEVNDGEEVDSSRAWIGASQIEKKFNSGSHSLSTHIIIITTMKLNQRLCIFNFNYDIDFQHIMHVISLLFNLSNSCAETTRMLPPTPIFPLACVPRSIALHASDASPYAPPPIISYPCCPGFYHVELCIKGESIPQPRFSR